MNQHTCENVPFARGRAQRRGSMAKNNEKLRLNNNGNHSQLQPRKAWHTVVRHVFSSNMAKDIMQPNAQFENDEWNEKDFFSHDFI